MTMCESDPELTRWGLHLLYDPVSCFSYENDSCVGGYGSEGNLGTDHTNVESAEVATYSLLEEFSQLATVEASGLSHASEEQAQISVLCQDWQGSTTRVFVSGRDGGQEDGNDVASSSCSSPENLHEVKEWNLELADDFHTVDEVGKRLNQIAPTPHKPRINRQIPSADEAISDHQRLLERLQLFELVERKVEGDGNCQFRALSDQFYRAPEHHKFVREQIIGQLKSHPEIYEGYVPMTYDEYLKRMSRAGEWGDHVTLQAAADSYGVKIFVITSFKDTCCIEILPSVQKSKRVILLSFWAEVHYNSIYPHGELPPSEPRRKKSWWPFGHRH